MEYMNFGKDKCVKLFSELDDVNGIGLIRRKKQGLGKPIMIYVMNFSANTAEVKTSANEEKRNESESVSENEKCSNDAELVASEVLTSVFPTLIILRYIILILTIQRIRYLILSTI